MCIRDSLVSGLPQLFPQVAHVLLQGVFRAVRRVQADALQNHGLCHRLPGILQQQLQNGVFRLGQVDCRATYGDLAAGGVQFHVPGPQHRGEGGRPLPQLHLDAGQQLGQLKGLGEVCLLYTSRCV